MLRNMLTMGALMVALNGCGGGPPIAPQQIYVDSRHVFEKNYSLGAEGSAYVGEPIARVKDYYETVRAMDVVTVSESFVLSSGLFHVDVPAGTIAAVRGTTTKAGKTYRVVALQMKLQYMNIVANPLLLLNEDGSHEGSAIEAGGFKTWHVRPATVRFVGTTVTKVDTSKGWKNFELIFGGVTKDSINVLYREYTPEDLVRAAYTQSLVYPADSKSIRFREMAITVKEASNERFRYVVTADGLK